MAALTTPAPIAVPRTARSRRFWHALSEAKDDLSLVLTTTVLLSVADALFTLVWIGLGVAHEANPLMAELLMVGPAAFFVGKMALVMLGAAVLWRYRERRLAAVGAFGALAAYYALLVFHFYIGLSI